jgi:hypothetical protein
MLKHPQLNLIRPRDQYRSEFKISIVNDRVSDDILNTFVNIDGQFSLTDKNLT